MRRDVHRKMRGGASKMKIGVCDASFANSQKTVALLEMQIQILILVGKMWRLFHITLIR